jgi:hypothetical protein
MNVHGHEVPQSVLDTLQARLRRGPATAGQLVDLADTFHCEYPMRTVDRWLQQQRRAGTAVFKDREWHWSESDRAPKHGV